LKDGTRRNGVDKTALEQNLGAKCCARGNGQEKRYFALEYVNSFVVFGIARRRRLGVKAFLEQLIVRVDERVYYALDVARVV
jgi:hypothetical protein